MYSELLIPTQFYGIYEFTVYTVSLYMVKKSERVVTKVRKRATDPGRAIYQEKERNDLQFTINPHNIHH